MDVGMKSVSALEVSSETIDNWERYLSKSKSKFHERLCVDPETTLYLSDFEIIQTVGTGTFGTVVLARRTTTERFYAIKILERARLVKMKQVKQTLNEKRILLAVDFSFLIRMEFFFKDNSYIYFVMPFINGGEMFHLLRKQGKFTENLARFYAAQIVLGLEYLHYLDIMYRDLKPENVLIDKTGYLKITDLGFAKIVKTRTYTFCGTPDYLAPEIILSKGYSHAVDWWSTGVLIYEMVAGFPPFYAKDPMKTYELIAASRYRNDPSFSRPLKDIIQQLLQADPSKRYGALQGGAADIKVHSWFRSTDWMDVLNRCVKPPYIPRVTNPWDASNFERYFDKHLRIASVEMFKDEFKDF